jgi:MFS family permease
MDQPVKFKPAFIFALMALFLCFEMALQVSPGVMTSSLIQDLHVDAFGLGLMSSVYFYTYTLMQIPSGLMYDRANFRTLVCVAILVCSIGAVLFSQSHSMEMGALSRLFMGFGSAFAFLSVLTVADRFFHARHFAYLAGIAQLLAALGGMAGNLPIAWLAHHWGWRETILAFAGIGFILVVMIWFTLVKPEEKKRQAVIAEPIKVSLKNILRDRQIRLLGIYVFLNWAPMTAFASLWGVPFLESAYHLNNQDAATATSMMWLGVGIVAPLIGALSDMLGRRNIVLTLTGLVGGASLALVIFGAEHLSFSVLCLLLFLAGGGSAGQIVTFAVAKDFTPPIRISTTIGIINMAMVASGMIMQPLIGKLLVLAVDQTNSVLPSVTSFQNALVILPVMFILCALLSFFCIKETYCGLDQKA